MSTTPPYGWSTPYDAVKTLEQQRARIAELEAESDRLDALLEQSEERVGTLYHHIAELKASNINYDRQLQDSQIRVSSCLRRIAELEAKVATYEADLEDPTLSVGEAYADRSKPTPPRKKPRPGPPLWLLK